jgi:hypothetical protein
LGGIKADANEFLIFLKILGFGGCLRLSRSKRRLFLETGLSEAGYSISRLLHGVYGAG